MRSLDIGATGMLAQQLNVDVISNNIANMTTTGYKRQRAAFTDLIYQNTDRITLRIKHQSYHCRNHCGSYYRIPIHE